VFNLSPIKIMLMVGVALILLGPDKLPQAARQIGSFWRSIRDFQRKFEADVRQSLPDLPSSTDIARAVRSPVNLLNTLADRIDPVPEADIAPEGTEENDLAQVDDIEESLAERFSPYQADPSVANEPHPTAGFDPGLN
jgi:Sec-independent protein translocase protein TatA